jgi:cytochrome c2
MRTKFTFTSISLILLLNALSSLSSDPVIAQTKGSSKKLFSKAPKPIIVQATGYKPKSVSIESRKGQDNFKELNCMACHSIHNTGGVIGPMLDGIGARRSSEYLYAHLADTQEQKEKFAKMNHVDIDLLHHPRLTVDTSKNLVAYLETLPEPAGGFMLYPHVKSFPAEDVHENPSFKPSALTESAMSGKRLYEQNGCAACHSINNIGGWLGPRLDGIGGRISTEEMVKYITKPVVKIRESTDEQEVWPQMPIMNFSKDEIDKLIAYLKTLPNLKNSEVKSTR